MNSPAAPPAHQYKVFIRETHLDTFGHVNNATYLTLFEEARWDMITGRGYGIPQIQERRLGPVILEAHVKFRREVKNRTWLTIESSVIDYAGKIGRLRQKALGPDGNLACDAEFTIALWDLDARKLVLPTQEWAQAIGLAL